MFIVRNESFICEYCNGKNPPAEKTCRNHCRECLCSKHVDKESPGDRKSTCHGKMKPIAILPGNKKTEYTILHECEKCRKEMKNRTSSDDNFEKMLEISEQRIFG